MSKYMGKVGYSITKERMVEKDGILIGSGIFDTKIVERPYSCELVKCISKWQVGTGTNDNINLSNQVSILADPYAYENFMHIRYVEFMKALWKVEIVEPQRPRLLLTVGGLWNGEQN